MLRSVVILLLLDGLHLADSIRSLLKQIARPEVLRDGRLFFVANHPNFSV